MIKKALLVGINDYANINDLRGCHSDITNMRDILKRYYGFENNDIRVLLDARATRENVLSRMDWLLEDLKSGDQIFFTFSGHGCFTGNTKVSLLDGTEITFEELEKTYKDKTFWVYSINNEGKIVPGKAHSPRVTKMSKVLEVKLDNGEVIICTPDHKFMLRDGSYCEAKNLTPNTSLMPLYKRISEKDTTIVKIISVSELTSTLVPVYDITVEKYHNFAITSGVFVHNSQVRDRDGDELRDGKDEILCLYEMTWDSGYILDDEFDSFFKSLPQDVIAEVVFDCCFSGTGTSVNISRSRLASSAPVPEQVVSRYLEPPLDIELRSEGEDLKVKRFATAIMPETWNAPQSHCIWSGCGEQQTSADAFIGGSFNGAFTYFFCKYIRESNGTISRRDILKNLRASLGYHGYTQIPELTCHETVADKLFFS